MDIYEYLDRMNPLIQRRDWNSLESEFRNTATQLAGAATADAIAAVDMTPYGTALSAAMGEAYGIAAASAAQAIYFEYDLDNGWESNFFICQDYSPVKADDEDWACDWMDEVAGPGLAVFAEIYKLTGSFDRTDAAKGTTLYLVARTVAVFGRCSESYPDAPNALCIAFHDQSPIMRVKERKGS